MAASYDHDRGGDAVNLVTAMMVMMILTKLMTGTVS